MWHSTFFRSSSTTQQCYVQGVALDLSPDLHFIQLIKLHRSSSLTICPYRHHLSAFERVPLSASLAKPYSTPATEVKPKTLSAGVNLDRHVHHSPLRRSLSAVFSSRSNIITKADDVHLEANYIRHDDRIGDGLPIQWKFIQRGVLTLNAVPNKCTFSRLLKSSSGTAV
jgi:hypothetical protein